MADDQQPSNADIMRALGKLDGQMEVVHADLQAQGDRAQAQLTQHAERIYHLERSQNRILGGAIAAAALVSGAVVAGFKKVGIL